MVWTGSSWGRIQCGQDLCEAGCSTRSVAGGIQVVVDPVSARSRCCEIHVGWYDPGWFVLCFRWEWGPGVCQVHEGSQVLRPHSYQLQTGCLWHTAQCKYHKVPGTQTAQYKYHRVLVYWGHSAGSGYLQLSLVDICLLLQSTSWHSYCRSWWDEMICHIVQYISALFFSSWSGVCPMWCIFPQIIDPWEKYNFHTLEVLCCKWVYNSYCKIPDYHFSIRLNKRAYKNVWLICHIIGFWIFLFQWNMFYFCNFVLWPDIDVHDGR